MTSMRLCGGDITIIPTIRMSIGQISLYGESLCHMILGHNFIGQFHSFQRDQPSCFLIY